MSRLELIGLDQVADMQLQESLGVGCAETGEGLTRRFHAADPVRLREGRRKFNDQVVGIIKTDQRER